MMPRTVVDFIGYMVTDTRSQQPIRRVTRKWIHSEISWGMPVGGIKRFIIPSAYQNGDFAYHELFDIQMFQTESYQCK